MDGTNLPASEGCTVIADLRGKDVLSNLTGWIVESYHDLEAIEHLDQSPLPNYQVVIGIATDLKEILFPGLSPAPQPALDQCAGTRWRFAQGTRRAAPRTDCLRPPL